MVKIEVLRPSAEGDLYAGRNGNIYKKDDNGWQQYDRNDGGWKEFSNPTDGADREALKGKIDNRGSGTDPARLSSDRLNQASRDVLRQGENRFNRPDYSQLNRDLHARQRGYQQFNTRRGMGGMSGARGGMSRSRAGRGRRR